MAWAVREQLRHGVESRTLDRSGWTNQRWVEDAERLMNDPHGAVTSLVNGHVMALIQEVRDLRATLGDAQRGALLEARNDLATYRDPDDLRNAGIEFVVDWLDDRAREI